jgi:pyruvate dehydrogenase E2 component (dihydrolipoamide acetyltransferase)
MMPVDIVMPPLSQTTDSLVFVEWFKTIGDTLTKGEPLFSVETDKATLDVESPASGILTGILAEPGQEIQAYAVIGQIAVPDEEGEPAIPSAEQPILSAASVKMGIGKADPENQTNSLQIPTQAEMKTSTQSAAFDARIRERTFSSPRARSLLQQKGIDIETLKVLGTGPQGAVVERDVIAYLQSQERPVERSGNEIKLSPTQITVARRMLESHASIPPVTYMREVDVTALVELRQRILSYPINENLRPSYTDFFVAFTCRAVRKYPTLNATQEGERFQQHEAVHLALAVDSDRGLVAPVIRNADERYIAELTRIRMDLVERAKNGKLKPEELSGGTFTLTNLGMLGVDGFTPIINPPQVAILGIGRIRKAPAVWQDEISIRSLIQLSLTCDHRVVDGALAARFLEELASIIQAPELYLL